MLLVISTVLPVGLSASYKQFVGGTTTITIGSNTGPNYSMTRTLGVFRGLGLSLMEIVAIPLIGDFENRIEASELGGPSPPSPKERTAYGFTAYVIDANTTTLVDALTPDYISSIRRAIRPRESRHVEAYVNGTFCLVSNTKLSPSRMDSNFWISEPLDRVYDINLYYNFHLGILSVHNSLIYLSIGNTSNSTFPSEAVGFNLFRGQCHGKWQIITPSALLQDAYNCTGFSHI